MSRVMKTERLILRPLEVTDAADVFEWVSDPVVNRYMPYSLYENTEQVVEWIESLTEDGEFAFCLQETGKVIGSGSIGFDPKRGAYAFGYNLNQAYWGMGYATEAAKAMIRWAYEELGARDFTASHAIQNTASGRVIQKCGLTFSHYGQYSRFDGSETFDASYYVMHLD